MAVVVLRISFLVVSFCACEGAIGAISVVKMWLLPRHFDLGTLNVVFTDGK